MTIWEYQFVHGRDVASEKDLNKFGQEGWELCGVVRPNGSHSDFFVFKRVVSEETRKVVEAKKAKEAEEKAKAEKARKPLEEALAKKKAEAKKANEEVRAAEDALVAVTRKLTPASPHYVD